ncbi:MAG TPA: hypothetical protein VIF09_10135 [Polyangiaceae bacterium]
MTRKMAWGMVVGLGLAVPVALLACSSSSSGGAGSKDGGASTEGGSGVETGAGGDAGAGGDTGGNPEGGGGDGGAPTPSAECTAFATAKCAQDAQCNTDTMETSYGTTTQSECVTEQALVCAIYEAAANTGFTQANIQACTTAIQNSTTCPSNVPSPTGACAFQGTGAPGAVCGVAYQCASLGCSRTGGVACGTCNTTATAGQACDGTSGATCAIGLSCDTTTHKCLTEVGPGSVCDDGSHVCANGIAYSCTHVDGGASGTCQAAANTSGAACSRAGLGGIPGCSNALGFFCDTSNDKCAAISYVTGGTACGEVEAGTSDSICAGGSCIAGTCAANLGLGASCTVGKGAGCGPALQCVNATAGATSGTCQYANAANCH